MAETTKIEWADSTLNIWEGCQKTGSPACEGCYAEARNLRYAPKGTAEAPNWGPRAPRREVKSWRSTLRKISRLALAAFAAGRTEPWFVFVNSLSDFWDNQADPQLRAEAMAAFREHPHLTFLLLTKRPQNIVKMWENSRTFTMTHTSIGPEGVSLFGTVEMWPRNVAIGCTVVTQAEANRDVPSLLGAAHTLRPAFTFLSIEPMVEEVNIKRFLPIFSHCPEESEVVPDHLKRDGEEACQGCDGSGRGECRAIRTGGVDWVITGGGTDQIGWKAPPMHPAWPLQIAADCANAGAAYLHKQNGEWVAYGQHNGRPDENLGLPGPPREDRELDGELMFKVGKKAAGRALNGRTYDARPEVRR